MPRLMPLLLATLLCLGTTQAAELVIKDNAGSDCYVYTPTRINKSKTYWLVVGVHAYNGSGKGAAGLSKWAQSENCIVIGPSFKNGYQTGQGEHATKLLELQKQLSKKYRLHDKMFIHGFSAGAQFAHRFTFNHPEKVIGCSAHSAGSWATGNPWASITDGAKTIPFIISCGDKDTGKAFQGAPMSRIEWFEEFSSQMKEKNFKCVSKVLPNTGHQRTPEVLKMAKQCFNHAKK